MTYESIGASATSGPWTKRDETHACVQSFEGQTRSGWAVIRDKPWHFAGLFASRLAAETTADALGGDYAVREGVRREGTAFFRVTPSDPLRS